MPAQIPVKTINAADASYLEKLIATHAAQGYNLAYRNETSATMVRPKNYSALYALFFFWFMCLVAVLSLVGLATHQATNTISFSSNSGGSNVVYVLGSVLILFGPVLFALKSTTVRASAVQLNISPPANNP